LSVSRKTFPLLAAPLAALLMLAGATNAHADSGVSAPSFTTLLDNAQINQSQPHLQVEADPSASEVTLYDVDGNGDPQEIGSTPTIDSDGTTTVTPDSPLADGTHLLEIAQTVGPDQSDMSDVVSVDVNTAAPTLESPTDGTLTNESKPLFEVSGALHNTVRDAQVAIYVDGQFAGQDSSDDGGEAGLFPDHHLADGAHTAYAVTVDDLGHTGDAHSNLVHFTVDTVAPGAPTIISPADGSTLTTATPTITVHAEPGAHVYGGIDQAIFLGPETADADGNATFAVTDKLADGSHVLGVFTADAAGNYGDGASVNFTVATAAPPTTPTTPTKPATPVTPTLATPSKVKLSSSTLTKGHPVKLSFTITKPSTVTLTLTQRVKGKTKTAAKISFKVKKAGKASYTLSTKIGKHKLAKGRYTLSLQTTAGTQTSKSVTQTLTVR